MRGDVRGEAARDELAEDDVVGFAGNEPPDASLAGRELEEAALRPRTLLAAELR